MTTRSRDPRLISVGSNTEDIFWIARSSGARYTQAAHTEMAAQIINIRVPDFWNNEPTTTIQETTNLPATDQYTDDLPVSGGDQEFLHDNAGLYVARLNVQNMISSAMLWYVENAIRWQLNRMIRSAMVTHS